MQFLNHGNWLHLKLFRINSVGTLFQAILGWPLLVLGLYFCAALIGSLIPVNADWAEPKDGATLYLHDNGIHTSFIIPCAPDGGATACLFPTEYAKTHGQTRWQMIGWGDREFYLNTPTWRDLDLGTAATAIMGSGRTLVHVDNLNALPATGIRSVTVDHKTMGRIMDSLYGSVTSDKDTRRRLMPIKGYGHNDLFYEVSQTRIRNYSIVYTCNNWVSEILAKAGVRTGYWTPLPYGVLWWF
jgi:uncharacterized protein (TIGR02117 family)